MRIWSLGSMELVVQFQVLNQVIICGTSIFVLVEGTVTAWHCKDCCVLVEQPKAGEIHAGGAFSAFTVYGPTVFTVIRSLPWFLFQSCQCLAWKPHTTVAWEAESQHVVAGYSDGTIRVFSISRTEMELKMHPHATALTAIAYSTDGEVPCCNSGEMLLWGAVTSHLTATGFFISYKKCLVPFPLAAGEMILSGGKDGLVAVSSPRTGMTIRVLADHKGSPITVLQCTRKQVRPSFPSLPAAVQERVPRVSLHSCGKGQQHGWVGRPFSFLFVPTTPSNFC